MEEYLALYGREAIGMRRALVAPLPLGPGYTGLGHLINRQLGKGALLVAAAILLFMLTLGFAFHELCQAVLALGATPGRTSWPALRVQLLKQGVTWLVVLGGSWPAV